MPTPRMPHTPCALSISGLDPTGGAGLFADLRAFAAASVWGCGAVAVVTVQSTAGLRSSHPVPTPQLLDQIRELCAHQRIRCIKIGALGSRGNVAGVTRLLRSRSPKVPIVLDPVMRSTLGRRAARLLEDDARSALFEMFDLATVVTPNIPEAEAFLGTRIDSLLDAERAARALVRAGARAALVKGGHLRGRAAEAIDVLAVGTRVIHLRAPRVRGSIHGTGCTLASLIAGRLAHADRVDDEAIVDAVRWAKQRLKNALRHPIRIGPGQMVLAP
jgi:hydroxymethylpyrimidine kinase/phosphomethylpyrimidine kinase